MGAKTSSNGLITNEFRSQALAFPKAVDRLLSEIKTFETAKNALDKGVVMAKYASQIKASIDIERPIALGVLKLKGKVGVLSPPEKGGRGKTTSPAEVVFAPATIAAYRKIGEHLDRLDDYYESTDTVPTQGEFIRFATGGRPKKDPDAPWTLFDGIEAVNKAIHTIFDRWPEGELETLAAKLISVGQEIRDTRDIA